MSLSKTKSSTTSENLLLSFIKGLIVSMLISFVLIIILAFSIKWFSIGENLISPLNLVIKTISVLIGSIIAVKGETKGLFKGVIFGFLYVSLAFGCFSFLAKSFTFDMSLFLDVIFACVVGGIVGIIKVNR